MSADGDMVAYSNSVSNELETSNNIKFNDKNYTFITDSTSNSGVFSSGQIQFDLSSLSSQSQWISLNEAIIEVPVKIVAKVTQAVVTGSITNAKCELNSFITKNSWNQWINSCQLIINGQTIQTAQNYENISATFKMLTEFSQDSLQKHASTLAFAIDDCTDDSEVDATYQTSKGANNSVFSSLANSITGFDNTSNQATLFNKGTKTRATMTNIDILPSSATLSTTILGASQMKASGMHNVSCRGTTGSNTAGDVLYSANYLATIRLRDICSVENFPLVKNLKGFLYLGLNSSSVQITGPTGSAAITPAVVSITPTSGMTTPFTINNSGTSGLSCGNSSTSSVPSIITITAGANGSATDDYTNAGPIITSARLLVPYYLANPKADSALTMSNHFFTSIEKIVNPITVSAGASTNYTITVGVPNARRLLLLPMWQNLGGTTNLTNPELSVFETCPASTGLHANLLNLQVYLGNKPIYQYPINYGFEQWIQENSQVGNFGSNVNEVTSGLLSKAQFEQNHRYYTVDLSRRMDSEDGSSKSVQVSFTNPSASYGMKVIAIVYYEKRWVMNTGTCTLSSV
jgi:hypothetical protein